MKKEERTNDLSYKILEKVKSFLPKLLIMIITAILAGVALDSDNKYLNIFDRAKIFLTGVPEYKLIAEDQDDAGSLLLLNNNNSKAYIYYVNFKPTSWKKITPEQTSTSLPSTGSSAPFSVNVNSGESSENSGTQNESNKGDFSTPLKVDSYDDVRFLPITEDGDANYIHEIEPRSARNLTFDFSLSPNEKNDANEKYEVEGKISVVYYIHTTRKTVDAKQKFILTVD